MGGILGQTASATSTEHEVLIAVIAFLGVVVTSGVTLLVNINRRTKVTRTHAAEAAEQAAKAAEHAAEAAERAAQALVETTQINDSVNNRHRYSEPGKDPPPMLLDAVYRVMGNQVILMDDMQTLKEWYGAWDNLPKEYATSEALVAAFRKNQDDHDRIFTDLSSLMEALERHTQWEEELGNKYVLTQKRGDSDGSEEA